MKNWQKIIIAFIVWVILLTGTIMLEEGILQIGGTDFKLKPNDYYDNGRSNENTN